MSSETLASPKKRLESPVSLVCARCGCLVGLGIVVRHKLYCLPDGLKLVKPKRKRGKRNDQK